MARIMKTAQQQKKESKARTADQVQDAVAGILSQLRKGRVARIPGLGSFSRGRDSKLKFEEEKESLDAA